MSWCRRGVGVLWPLHNSRVGFNIGALCVLVCGAWTELEPSTPLTTQSHVPAAPFCLLLCCCCFRARIDTLSKARYGTLLRQLGGWSWMQDVLTVLHEIGQKHGVSPSCVASRWVLQQPGVSAVILGARNASHVRVGDGSVLGGCRVACACVKVALWWAMCA